MIGEDDLHEDRVKLEINRVVYVIAGTYDTILHANMLLKSMTVHTQLIRGEWVNKWGQLEGKEEEVGKEEEKINAS